MTVVYLDLAVGLQRTTVHWNATGLRFGDISALTHLDRPGQWRSIALGDLDGDPDIIIGGFGEPPRVYRNDIAPGHQLTRRLRGTLSNALGAGARVEAFRAGDDRPVTRVMGSYASPMQGVEPVLFLGAGADERVPRMRVIWPSGVAQELGDLATGRVHEITEPLGFAIDPTTRHVPADGRSAATLRVTPRAGAAVGARLRGPGALSIVRDGDAWVVRVVAPSSPGSTNVILTLDGSELRVRPRLWWDMAR